MVRKTISMPDEMGDWIADRLADGRYNNESEYVRALIRRDQDEQLKLEHLRAALARGESDLAAGRYTDLASARDIGGFLDEIDAEAAPDEPS
jgi:antitoxin ParD1/3/4